MQSSQTNATKDADCSWPGRYYGNRSRDVASAAAAAEIIINLFGTLLRPAYITRAGSYQTGALVAAMDHLLHSHLSLSEGRVFVLCTRRW